MSIGKPRYLKRRCVAALLRLLPPTPTRSAICFAASNIRPEGTKKIPPTLSGRGVVDASVDPDWDWSSIQRRLPLFAEHHSRLQYAPQFDRAVIICVGNDFIVILLIKTPREHTPTARNIGYKRHWTIISTSK
jgi:hypothetical protein